MKDSVYVPPLLNPFPELLWWILAVASIVTPAMFTNAWTEHENVPGLLRIPSLNFYRMLK
jgi:hypothetical protein